MCFSSPKLPEPKPTPIPGPTDPEVTAAGERQRRRVRNAQGVSRSVFAGAVPAASQLAPSLAIKTALGL